MLNSTIYRMTLHQMIEYIRDFRDFKVERKLTREQRAERRAKRINKKIAGSHPLLANIMKTNADEELKKIYSFDIEWKKKKALFIETDIHFLKEGSEFRQIVRQKIGSDETNRLDEYFLKIFGRSPWGINPVYFVDFWRTKKREVNHEIDVG